MSDIIFHLAAVLMDMARPYISEFSYIETILYVVILLYMGQFVADRQKRKRRLRRNPLKNVLNASFNLKINVVIPPGRRRQKSSRPPRKNISKQKATTTKRQQRM